MKATEHIAKTASMPKAGLFALLRVGGSGAPSRRRVCAMLAILAMTLGALVFAATPALALKAHLYSSSFGSEGSGPGQFKEPAGVAVNDATGGVYVVDKGNKRVQEFNSTGTTVLAEFAPPEGFSEPEAIAIDNSGSPLDPSKEDVYVTDPANKAIDKFSATGTYLGQITKAQGGSALEELQDVAVDPNGVVWADQECSTINAFSDEEPNQFLSRREPQGPEGSAIEGCLHLGLGVDSEGSLYVVHGGNRHVAKLDNGGRVLQPPGEALGGASGTTRIAVDPVTDNVFLDSAGVIAAFNATGSSLERFGSEQLSTSSGLAVNAASKTAYASDTSANAVRIFNALTLPTVGTGAATNVTEPVGTPGEDTATLNGTVDPEGVPLTTCEFEYVADESYTARRLNEHQTLTFVGATEGTFTLTVKGQTTTAIEYRPGQEQAFPQAISEAIGALSSVGGSQNIAVTGPNGGPYTVEFKGALADTNIPQLTTDSSGLTPAGATVTPATATDGGDGWETATAAPCSPEAGEVPTGSGAVQISANLTALSADTLYHYRLRAGNANHELDNGESVGEAGTFVAIARPRISGEVVSNVESSSATVGAQVRPGGSPTTYKVEYGTLASGSYASSTPEQSLGGALSSVGVQAQLTGLQAGVDYHFRFVAINSVATVPGEGVAFTTAASSGPSASTLPDNRAYELVSSSTSNANVYPPEGEFEALANRTYHPVRASAGGDAVLYLGDPPAEGPGAGNIGGRAGNEYLAARGPGGWTQTDLQLGAGLQYQGFSGDLSVGVLNPEAASSSGERVKVPSAAPAEPENCQAHAPPLFSYTSGDRGYHAFFSATPTQAQTICVGVFAGGNPGTAAVPQYSHLLFENRSALTPEANSPSSFENHNLYDSVGGQLHMVNVLPNGQAEPEPNAKFAGTNKAETEVSLTGPAEVGSPSDISADGSRVFWRSVNTGDLYLRLNPAEGQSAIAPGSVLVNGEQCTEPAKACTVQIDASQTGGTGGGGIWRTASLDGSRVYFTDCNQLTTESTAVSTEGCEHGPQGEEVFTGNDLYEYDLNSGKLTDLTVDNNAGDPLRADVQGVVGTSQNGEYVYLVAGGALAPGSESHLCNKDNESGEEQTEELEGKLPPARGCNLYLRHGGVTTFLAELAPRDNFGKLLGIGPASGDWVLEAGGRTAEVTPDGRSLVFRSVLSLTGYNNRAENTFRDRYEALPEVFVYSADTGHLVCASCSPSGTPPTSQLKSPGSLASNIASEAFEHGAFLTVSNNDTFLPHWISDSGARVFFVSAQPLAPQAVNGLQNVYEWEREGEGSCPAGKPRGCIYLLSGGTSTDESYFLDASASGNDVFFRTREKLVSAAHNENMALYDARVGGGFPETTTACTGTGCQGAPPGSPIFATPSSVTFNGAGNFPGPPPPTKATGCKRGFVKKHGKCVKAKTTKCRRGFVKKHTKCVKAKAKKKGHKTGTKRRTKR